MTDFELCGECRFGYWKDGATPSDTMWTCILSEVSMFSPGTCSLPVPACGYDCPFYSYYDPPCHWCKIPSGNVSEQEVKRGMRCRVPAKFRATLLRALTTGDFRETGEDDASL